MQTSTHLATEISLPAGEPDLRTTWETYGESWKVPGADDKLELFGRCLADQVTYTDPDVDLAGWDALVEYMLAFHQQLPGGHFATRWFQAHHGRSIARWDMVAGDGTVVGAGISHARYAPDGRLEAMTGFFEPPAG